MLAPGIVVLEKRSWWEAELKRALAEDAVEVRVCRLPAQVAALLAKLPESVLVLHLELDIAECLRLVAKAAQMTPPVRTVVLAPRAVAELEWPARELGAVEFLIDTVSGPNLAQLCRRLLG